MITQSYHALYRCEQIRSCEQLAVKSYNISEHELMARAGADAFSRVLDLYPRVRHLAVYCGGGNNAGDGYVLARLARQKGLNVTIYQSKLPEDLPATAADAAAQAMAAGVVSAWIDEPLDPDVDLIIDALLGIGLKGEVRGELVTTIHQINETGLPVVALDVPSGLDADTGKVFNCCVLATQTITFIAIKVGMLTLDGPDHCGKIYCTDLQLAPILEKVPAYATQLSSKVLNCPLAPRLKNSHKGDFGQVLVIGGGLGMPGAGVLSAQAALRAGAGSVVLATWPSHAATSLPGCPEAMIYGVKSAKELKPLLARASVCVIGPGLGDQEWGEALFLAAISSQLPMVIDASALRLLAKHTQSDDHWILTPHPGEAAALLSWTAEEVQSDRFKAVDEIQQQYGGVVVLKGAGSVIRTAQGHHYVSTSGNPGMATAGMGDVLSGILGGLLAQGLSLSEAAKLAVWLHGHAADSVAEKLGQRGLLASDLLSFIPKILNGVRA